MRGIGRRITATATPTSLTGGGCSGRYVRNNRICGRAAWTQAQHRGRTCEPFGAGRSAGTNSGRRRQAAGHFAVDAQRQSGHGQAGGGSRTGVKRAGTAAGTGFGAYRYARARRRRRGGSMRSRPSALRDFTVDNRVWLLTGVALFIGTGAAALAVVLLRAIALATNAFYYHRLSLAMVGPAGSPLSPWHIVLVPVIGGVIVGLLAHYGSDK